MLTTEFLNESFIKYQSTKSLENRMNIDLIKSQKYFTGMIMSVKLFKNICLKSSICSYNLIIRKIFF